jgi:mRNA interferase MazF
MVRRGDIYIVSFDPVRGFEQGGVRPALVIQNEEGNEFASTTIVAAMSSQHRDYPVRVMVSPKQSGLRESSSVMLDQIRTISQARLGRKVGQLTPDKMEDVDEALHRSLGLLD